MPLRTAEAFILRTYALRESDKIVSFFTREFGKCRGVARGARRPKSRYGSALEPLSQVRVQFFEREGKDLCNLDHCELLHSMMAGANLLHSVATAVMVEVAERLLPDHEVNDPAFRLLLGVLPPMREASEEGAVWLPLTYYLFWMVRIGGFLPAVEDADAGRLAAVLARQPVGALDDEVRRLAAAGPGRSLRQFLRQVLEAHVEARLQSWPLLASLEAVD